MKDPRASEPSVRGWKRSLLCALNRGVFRLITRRRIIGLEHVPAEGGCVLVFNHLSNFDAPLLLSVVRRSKATGLAAADYRERPLHRAFVEAAGGVWLKRGASDRASLEHALMLLEQGWLVAIAPEGRRSRTKALVEGKRGPAFLAMRARVPVLPVALSRTERIGSSLKRLRRAAVTVRFGQTIPLPPLEGGNHKQQLQAATDVIMAHLATLLPPEYRGVYTGFVAPDAPSTG